MRRIAFVLLAALATGCATPYMADRGRDAKDVFTAAAGFGGGAKARVGPIAPAFIANFNYTGLVGGDHFWGYEDYAGDRGMDCCLLPPIAGGTGHDSSLTRERRKYHEAHYMLLIAMPIGWECNPPIYPATYFSQVEVTAGLGLMVKLGFNPGELLDFLLGWTTVDIYNDDISVRAEDEGDAGP